MFPILWFTDLNSGEEYKFEGRENLVFDSLLVDVAKTIGTSSKSITLSTPGGEPVAKEDYNESLRTIIRKYGDRFQITIQADKTKEGEKERIQQLIRDLEDKDRRVRLVAVQVLERMSEKAENVVPTLIKALKNKDKSVRIKAAEVLGRMGEKGKDAVPALIEALKTDESDNVRKRAIQALLEMDVESEELVPELVQRLIMNNWREPAPLVEMAVPTFIKALEARNRWIREMAARALGLMGKKAEVALPALLKTLKEDKERWVRVNAARSIEKIRRNWDRKVPAMIDALIEEPAGADIQGKTARVNGKTVEKLRTLFKKGCSITINKTPEGWAIDSLGETDRVDSKVIIREKELIQIVLELLKDNDERVRENIFTFLVRICEEKDNSELMMLAPILYELCEPNNDEVLFPLILTILKKGEATEITSLLLEMLEHEVDYFSAVRVIIDAKIDIKTIPVIIPALREGFFNFWHPDVSEDLPFLIPELLLDVGEKVSIQKLIEIIDYAFCGGYFSYNSIFEFEDRGVKSLEEDYHFFSITRRILSASNSFERSAIAKSLIKPLEKRDIGSWMALKVLEMIGPEAKEVAPSLARIVKDPGSEYVKWNKYKQDYDTYFPDLLAKLADSLLRRLDRICNERSCRR